MDRYLADDRVMLGVPSTVSPQAPPSAVSTPTHGALVISLDFELRWGVRDMVPLDGGHYRANLLGVRRAVPRILELFDRHAIAATWATVGFLFARDRDELRTFLPERRPRYVEARYDPYAGIADGESELDFAPDLIESVVTCPRQEIGSHTFSHYYCLEAGQTKETFEADLDAAIRIARARGVSLRSLVLPRNQMNPDYASVLIERGIVAVRGNPRSWMYGSLNHEESRHPARRVARMVDAYVGLTGDQGLRWSEVRQDGICNVAASHFLRPYSHARRPLEGLRLRRVTRAIEAAARNGRIYHLWWHPHNFGVALEDNLRFLESILVCAARARERWGLRSLSMGEVASVLGS